jgi:hypothetical protein
MFGKANSSAINLSTIADASNPLGGFVINGEALGDQSGISVSSASVNENTIFTCACIEYIHATVAC